MHKEYYVEELQAWMSGFQRKLEVSIQRVRADIDVTNRVCREWDDANNRLAYIREEIRTLQEQLMYCSMVLGDDPELQRLAALRRQAIQDEISHKVCEQTILQKALAEATSEMQKMYRTLTSDGYFFDLKHALQESQTVREKAADYQEKVQKAEIILAGFGSQGNTYARHVIENVTAPKKQIITLTGIQRNLLAQEKRIMFCYQDGYNAIQAIFGRIGDEGVPLSHEQKHIPYRL